MKPDEYLRHLLARSDPNLNIKLEVRHIPTGPITPLSRIPPLVPSAGDDDTLCGGREESETNSGQENQKAKATINNSSTPLEERTPKLQKQDDLLHTVYV